mgnify:FL=1
MAIPVLNHMDFQQASEIRNVLLHITGSGSVSGNVAGQIIYDSGSVKFNNGSGWVTLSASSGTMSNFIISDGSTTQTIADGNTITFTPGEGIDLSVAATDTVNISAETATATNLGVAKFSTDNFAVSNGNVTIKDGGVALAEMADIADDRVLGNVSGGAAAPSALTAANIRTLINVADGAQANVGTNLSQTTAAGQLTIASSTGDDIVVAEATTSIAGLMSTTHHDKLDGIAAGAQVNVSGDSGNAAIYDNSGTPAFKSGITKAEVHTLLNIEDGATADQTAAEIRTLVGTGNGNFVPSAGSSGTFLAHDGVYRTPTYINNTDIDVNVANLTARLPQITESVTIGDATDVVVTTSGNLVVTGDLTVSGDTITANVGTLDVEDKNITLNKSAGDSSSTADGAGITIQDAVDASNDASMSWNAAGDKFVFSHPVDVTGILTATGTSVFANLDISGDVDVDGTLEADAITVNGSTLQVVVEDHVGAMLDGTETFISVSYDATDNNLDFVVPVKDEDNMASNAADHLATQQSIKAYVDGQDYKSAASAAEVQTGSNTAKFVTPDTLAAKSVHSTIDISDSDFVSNLYAEIEHGLGTEDVIVQLFDSSTKETVLAEVARTDKAGSASTSKIKILFSSAPSNDIEVMVTSIKGSTAKTAVYA